MGRIGAVGKRTLQSILYIALDSWHTLSMSPYESNVKEYREQAGLSQEALARQLGVSRQTITNIERGLSEPRVLLAIAIAAALGVAVQQLFRREPTA